MAGLTAREAAERLELHGPNELPAPEKKSLWSLVREALVDPMLALLVGAATVHLLLGELKDSVVLLMAVILVLAISIRQEWKSEKALQALRDLSAPKAFVIRDGLATRIPATEVVVGDELLLEPGDRIAADGTLIGGTDIAVDESLLTGESVPVPKLLRAPLFSGSLVVKGRGVATVTATGFLSELGKLGHSLRAVQRVINPVERELRNQVRKLALVAIGICVLVSSLQAWRTGNWLTGVLAGLALAIAMIPEEFPVVSRIFLALGAWRLSASNVLTRNLGALQTLAHTSVLCVDKTGTLTLNRLAVRELVPIEGDEERLLQAAALASDASALDPIDAAILAHSEKTKTKVERRDPTHVFPISMAAMSLYKEGDSLKVYVKGAPEVVMQLCNMNPDTHSRWHAAVERATSSGLKVLGVATGTYQGELSNDPPDGLTPLGLVALLDPLRIDVAQSVAEARRAGIRVLVMTGDHAKTAETIAHEAGIPVDRTVNGTMLEAMRNEELAEALAHNTLFSRVTPSQKLRLVTALKAMGMSVAMTGDGVNDAPALRAADVGIAMGKRGTDVARETADMVLVNDDFASIVAAIRMAREIREKLERAVRFIIAVHVPIAALALLPFAFGWPIVLLPLHVVLLELVIDPACSMVFDAEEPAEHLMDRSPSRFSAPLFGIKTMASGLAFGGAAAVGVVIVFALSFMRVGDVADARTLAFATLLMMDVALVWLFRSRTRTIFEVLTHPNRVLWLMTALVVTLLVLATSLDSLQNPLRLVELHFPDYVLVAGVVLTLVTLLDAQKLIRRRAAAT